MLLVHEIEPVFDERSKILILGTMPSPKSREEGFFYAHPRNRLWPVLTTVLGESVKETSDEKKAMLLAHRIAMWDVLAKCEIKGADDASIKDPVPSDLSVIISKAPISAVFTTGSKAFELYSKYQLQKTGLAAIKLPSTSPANCKTGFDELVEAYSIIKDYL